MSKHKIYYTNEKFLHFEDKIKKYELDVLDNYNGRIQLLFQNIIEPSLIWFSNEILNKSANVATNIKTLNDNCEIPITMNSLLVHFNKVRNELSHSDPPTFGKEEYEYFNYQTHKFIRFFKPEELKESVTSNDKINNIVESLEIEVLDSFDERYIGRFGHYKINNEEFISIYGFKKKFGINNNKNNGEEALQILNQGIKSYKSVPEIGSFKIVRIFPLHFLQKFYKTESPTKINTLIDEEYYKLINGLDKIEVLIIGQDPYPFGAMGIAFCTDDFSSLMNNNCCGNDVLKSLGVDCSAFQKEGKTPKNLFFYLATKQGIVFLNIAYEKLGNDATTNVKIIEEAFDINKPILSKTITGNIVAAGTKCQQILISKYNLNNFLSVIHPSKLNRDSENQSSKLKWKQYWEPNKLKELLKL